MCEPRQEILELRGQLDEFRQETRERSDNLQAKVDGLRQEVGELREEVSGLRQELYQGLDRVIRKTRVLLEGFEKNVMTMLEGIDVRDKTSQLNDRVTDLEDRAERTDIRLEVLEKSTDDQS